MANKKKKKTIDIILPNYNSVPFVEETIKSVINQTYTNWRLYIVDDCSDRQTLRSLKKFSEKLFDINTPLMKSQLLKTNLRQYDCMLIIS